MERNPFERHKDPESLDIYVPSQEDLETKEFAFLHKKYVENHKKLLPRVLKEDYPFFGLHGTSDKNVELLSKDTDRNRLELATFYEKERNEFFLYKLYAMASYVVVHATKSRHNKGDSKSKGTILVFNIEKNAKNSTHPWEHLLSSNDDFVFKIDSPTENRYRKAMVEEDNMLYRTGEHFDVSKELSEGRLKIIKLEDIQQLIKPFERGSKDIAYIVLQRRFRDQEIIKRILDLYREGG